MRNLFVAAIIASFAFGAMAVPVSAKECGPAVAQVRGGCIPQPPPSCPLFKKFCGEPPAP